MTFTKLTTQKPNLRDRNNFNEYAVKDVETQ